MATISQPRNDFEAFYVGEDAFDRQKSLREALDPRRTPAMAVQTYEYFESDKAARSRAIDAFVDGITDTIDLEYTKLFDRPDMPSLDEMEKSLEDVMLRMRNPFNTETDDETAKITYETALFRYKEVQFLRTVQRLNEAQTDEDKSALSEVYRSQNEALYGAPNPEIFEQICGEIWSELDSKELGPKAQAIYEELQNGFTARGREMHCLPRSERRLPIVDTNTVEWVKQQAFAMFPEIYSLCKRYWNNAVLAKTALLGVKPRYTNVHLAGLMQESKYLMYGFSSSMEIREIKNSSVLAWNTPTVSVDVGMSPRQTIINGPEKAFGKVFHELIGHGGKAVKGLSTNVPVLGMGVFSEADTAIGERPDYLTFEEAVLSLIEGIVNGEMDDRTKTQWNPERYRNYMMISLSSLCQFSEVEVSEIMSRYEALLSLKPGEDIDDKKMRTARKTVAAIQVRYKRSIPRQMPASVGRIGFHKDLAYTGGKPSAISVLTAIARNNDAESFRNLLATKIDPTNRRQREMSAKHGYPVRIQ